MKNCLILISSLFFSSSALAQLPFNPITLPQDDAAHYLMYSNPTPNQSPQFTEWWYFNGQLNTHDENGNEVIFGYYLSLDYIYINLYFASDLKIKIPFLMFQFTNLKTKEVLGNNFFYFLSDEQFNKAFRERDLGNNNSLYNIIEDENTHSRILMERLDEKTIHVSFTGMGKNSNSVQKNIVFDSTFTFDTKNFLPVGNEEGYYPASFSTLNKAPPYTYYYSYTRMKNQGNLTIGSDSYAINPEKGSSWFDRQYGDFMVTPWQSLVAPWFWQSILINSNDGRDKIDLSIADVMPGDKNQSLRATVLLNDKVKYIKDFSLTPYCTPDSLYPSSYKLEIPEISLSLDININIPGQVSNGISEAYSDVTGSYDGNPVSGFGFSESTKTYPPQLDECQ